MLQKELARRIGRPARHVAARLSLLELPTVVQDELHAATMTVAECQALLVFREQPELIERPVADEWNRRDIKEAPGPFNTGYKLLAYPTCSKVEIPRGSVALAIRAASIWTAGPPTYCERDQSAAFRAVLLSTVLDGKGDEWTGSQPNGVGRIFFSDPGRSRVEG